MVNSNGVVGVDAQNLELSFCRFFNYSQLRYSCHTHHGSENSINKPNAFEVTQYLRGRYDPGKGTGFKNISLLFHFQGNSLCVASSKKNVVTLKQVGVELPVDGTNIQHFVTCIKRRSHLERNYTFSCVTDIDKMKELSLAVRGYDVIIGSVWTADLKLDLVHNCSIVHENPDHDHKAIPYIPMMWVALAIVSISGSTIFLVIFVKCYKKRIKHAMSRRLYAHTLLFTKPSTSDSILLDTIPVDTGTSDTSQLHAVAAGSDFLQTNSTSGMGSHTSVHQQDDSSEDRSISPLPKAKYMIMPESFVQSWMESSL